jgi:hypothetical protein
MALHIDRNRIHGDMGSGHFDVYSKACAIASKALWANTELVYGLAEVTLKGCAFRVATGCAEWPCRRFFRQSNAEVRGSTNTYSDDRRWAGFSSRC